jgi:hypothetical protein
MTVDEASPAMARVRELDAAGSHDEAINALALAAGQGDVAATTALAKRIIVGDRAPRLLHQGIGLLEDAFRQGGAEAADRLALIRASGIAGAADWPAALRLLSVAADRGWEPARGQLAVLASLIGAGPGAAGIPGDAAAAADFRRVLAAPPGATIHEDPRIAVFPGFVEPPVCDWLIARARSRLERALVYDVVRQVDFADESRTNSAATFNMMDADLVHLLVQARMAPACGQPTAHMEAPSVLHYAVGETIGHHYDFVDPSQPGHAEEVARFGYRTLTFLVYLNDDYDGGETEFPRLGIKHAGRRGEGLFFVNTLAGGMADVRTLHAGLPPTRGEKWVFSQFVRNRPQAIG